MLEKTVLWATVDFRGDFIRVAFFGIFVDTATLLLGGLWDFCSVVKSEL